MTELIEIVKKFISEQYDNFIYSISNMSAGQIVINLLDILIMSAMFFAVYKFINKRRAGKLAVGLVVIIFILLGSTALGMKGLQFILSNFYQVGILAIIIVFQPELRSALEKVGGNPLVTGIKNIAMESKDAATVNNAVQAIVDATLELSKTKMGAIIVLEKTTKLGEYIKPERILDAQLNSSLLQNIFQKNAPLHDGAVIIRNFRIYAAGCFLPLPSNDDALVNLGSRHRAGVGVSEYSDALVVIVSEETGTISVAVQGELTRYYRKEELTQLVFSFLADQSIDSHIKRSKKKNKNINKKSHTAKSAKDKSGNMLSENKVENKESPVEDVVKK